VKYSVVTFGCRANQADACELDRALQAEGGEACDPGSADVIVVNTCSVTAAADQHARQAIRRLARGNPRASLVVTGCYATRQPGELVALPGVHRVVSNADKAVLPRLVRDGQPRSASEDVFRSNLAVTAPGFRGRTVHLLRAQTGCDSRCSYCVVPTTRGSSRSTPMGSVLHEAVRAVDAGFKELLLTGVHLGSYGRDLEPQRSLDALLTSLDALAGVFRVRLSSLEPMDVTPAVEELLTVSRRFAPHLHLPLQHGSDRVLARMRRPYRLDDYACLATRLRGRRPDAALGADVIVGFPGESAEDFQLTLDYLADSPLSYVHVFPYSDRPGTEAFGYEPKTPPGEIATRMKALEAVARRLRARFRAGQVGATREALTLHDGTLALTDNYLKVRIPAGRRRNEWVTVRIEADGDPMPATPMN
jgi:threonylcarbamoyladenosine tRNA methylthiotransferase MtaB